MDDQQMRDTNKRDTNNKTGDTTPRAAESGTTTANRQEERKDERGQSSGMATGTAGGSMEQARSVARNVGEQAWSAATSAGTAAQDLARRARDMSGADTLYQQGARAGEYLTRNVNEYPLAALLVAGAVGYGLAYLVHTQWQGTGSWNDGRRTERRQSRDHRD